MTAETSTSCVSPPRDSTTISCCRRPWRTLVRIGVGLIDLVDGDDDRNARRFGVVERFDRLRHDAVIGGDDENDDVRHLGHRGRAIAVKAAWPGVSTNVILEPLRAVT